MDIDGFIALAVIPDYEVSTPEARKALPEKVLLQEAAAQIGRALVFREAITAGNENSCIPAVKMCSMNLIVKN